MSRVVIGIGTSLAFLSLALATLAAWITHIVACIQAGAWILLVVGTLISPIGIIHGLMIWFGMSWAS